MIRSVRIILTGIICWLGFSAAWGQVQMPAMPRHHPAATNSASVELQSEFIDITGLFGVKQVAGVFHYTHQRRHWGVEALHSWTFADPGRAIQTFIAPRYRFQLDSAGHWNVLIKADLMYFRTANDAALFRPMAFVAYKASPRHTWTLGNWIFVQTHESALRPDGRRPLQTNGQTSMLAHHYRSLNAKYPFDVETRLVWNNTYQRAQVLGWVQQVKWAVADWGVYAGVNTALPLFRNPGIEQFNYSVFAGYAW